jgi:mannose-6-phosphate isomerase
MTESARLASPPNEAVQSVRHIDKPWGYELIYAVTDRYCGKILFIRAGEALSLQFHRRKDESIYVHEGRAELIVGRPGLEPISILATPGDSFRLQPGTIHSLRALEDTLLLEVSTPELDDVVRLEDRYGRV